jgi:hypothetical protein
MTTRQKWLRTRIAAVQKAFDEGRVFIVADESQQLAQRAEEQKMAEYKAAQASMEELAHSTDTYRLDQFGGAV